MRDFQPEKVPRPRDFGGFELPHGPLDIEIGCGVGYHPIRYARAHPERYLVAIEHTRTRYSSFEGRVRNHPPMGNLLPVHADAIAWIAHALPPASVDRYFLLYPNPYPKSKDQNKRWHAMPFFGHLLKTLKPGGTVLLATNEEFYFLEAKDFMTRVWGLDLLDAGALDPLHPLDPKDPLPRTHFEKKYLARGEICFQVLASKKPLSV